MTGLSLIADIIKILDELFTLIQIACSELVIVTGSLLQVKEDSSLFLVLNMKLLVPSLVLNRIPVLVGGTDTVPISLDV